MSKARTTVFDKTFLLVSDKTFPTGVARLPLR